jgi:23S rRNA A2030 N6-methylase RlmJ
MQALISPHSVSMRLPENLLEISGNWDYISVHQGRNYGNYTLAGKIAKATIEFASVSKLGNLH